MYGITVKQSSNHLPYTGLLSDKWSGNDDSVTIPDYGSSMSLFSLIGHYYVSIEYLCNNNKSR